MRAHTMEVSVSANCVCPFQFLALRPRPPHRLGKLASRCARLWLGKLDKIARLWLGNHARLWLGNLGYIARRWLAHCFLTSRPRPLQLGNIGHVPLLEVGFAAS